MTRVTRTRPRWENLTVVPQGSFLWATPTVRLRNRCPQAVRLPYRPGPYQLAPALRQGVKAICPVELPAIGALKGEAPPVAAAAGAAATRAAASAAVAAARHAAQPRLRYRLSVIALS